MEFQLWGVLESQWGLSSPASVSTGLTLECSWGMKVGSGALACSALLHSFSLGFSSCPPYLRGRLPRWPSGEQSSCWRRGRKRRGFGPWVREMRGEGNGNPLQYSCLESSMDRGAWWASVRGVAESRHDQVQRSRTLLQLRLVSQLISMFLSSGTPSLDDSTLSLPFRTLG